MVGDEKDRFESLITRTLSTVSAETAIRLYLQIRAWKKLSIEGKIGESIRFDKFSETSANSSSLNEFLSALSTLDQAFKPLPLPCPDDEIRRFLLLEKEIPALSVLETYENFPDLQKTNPFFRIVPIELLRFIISLLDSKPGDELYVPYPGNYFEAFVFAKLTDMGIVAGDDEPDNLSFLLRILDDTTRIVRSDSTPYRYSYMNLVIGFPNNSGNRCAGRSRDEKNETGIAAIERIIESTLDSVICLVPHSFLFRTVGSENRIKERLVKDKRIKSVISLPKNILPFSIMPIDILVFDCTGASDKTLFLDASKAFIRVGRKNTLSLSGRNGEERENRNHAKVPSVLVENDEIKQRHFNLLPSLYLQDDEIKLTNTEISKYPILPMKNIVEIIRATSIDGLKTLHPIPFPPQETYREVRVMNIPEYGFIESSSETMRTRDLENMIRNLLQPFDILLSVKGNVGWVGILPGEIRGHLVANQVFLILRVRKTVDYDPLVLLMYLKSDAAQTILHRAIAGSMVQTLQAKDIRNFPVPLFDAGERERIRAAFSAETGLYARIESLKAQIDEIRKAIV
jgi:hypothetical protein